MVYNDLNRCINGKSIVCDAHLRPPSFWTSSDKVKFKGLVNHRKGVTQPKLNKKIYKNQTTMGWQIQKLVVNNSRHERTSKYTKGNAIRAKIGVLNRKNLIYQSWEGKNEFRKMRLF
jgi:hypothetical protein